VSADNALVEQGEEHCDGWGVAYYQQRVPHLIKTADSAVADSLFQRVSGVVSSQTVLAHLRQATVGELSMINSHPFQHGKWVFAHNGNISAFDEHRDEMISRIAPRLRSFILGDTDSEVLFYLLLSNMQKRMSLEDDEPPLDAVVEAVEETVDTLRAMTGRNCYESPYDEDDELYLSFLLTDGHVMVGHQGGKPLYYSTHKTRCPERDTCPHFSDVCEAAVESGRVNHLIFASEPLQGENVWREMEPSQIVGVDARMELSKYNTPDEEAETVERAV
jgi:glutamine amidotransferase